MTCIIETKCRACDYPAPRLVMELGDVPLANALLKDPAEFAQEQKFPLTLAFCEKCTLLQIKETIDPSVLFKHYLYFSSFSDTMVAEMEKLACHNIKKYALKADDLVVDIACNDGYLLQFYKQQNIPVLGIDPAENVAIETCKKGIDVIVDFFDAPLAGALASEGKQAKIIHANNVLAHVQNLNGFVAGIKKLLHGDGVAIIETPYVENMIDDLEFDTIYHEHLCYYSVHGLKHLFKHHNLHIQDIEPLSIHGGSLRLTIGHQNTPKPIVQDFLNAEIKRGLTTFAYYADFGHNIAALKKDVLTTLSSLKASGQKIAAYGASAKGSTLMNYMGIGSNFLECVVDRNPHKQGYFTPGNHLMIKAPEALMDEKMDATLLLTWNFKDEILKQQSAYRENGGTFIIPLPSVGVIS